MTYFKSKPLLCYSVLILMCLFAGESIHAEDKALTVLVPKNIREDFMAFVGERSIISIDRYQGKYARREVIELVLLYQALYLGGYQGNITHTVQATDYRRNLQLLGEGKAVIYGTPVWGESIVGKENLFWLSEALVKDGEFVVGLYTAENNLRALAGRH